MSAENDAPDILAPRSELEPLGPEGRKLVLISKIDDCAMGGKIRVKRTSAIGKLGEPSINAHQALQINGLRMSVVRESVLREDCKPATILPAES